MNLTPTILNVPEKKLVGKSLSMSFANSRVVDLWQNFGPLQVKISNRVSRELISMTHYTTDHFENFNPNNMFEKWAAAEVSDFENQAENLDKTTIPAGLYAVFHYKGLNTNPAIYQYIFSTWIPQSEYELDDRPHFEVLGAKYKNNDPESEEDIFIPIKPKTV